MMLEYVLPPVGGQVVHVEQIVVDFELNRLLENAQSLGAGLNIKRPRESQHKVIAEQRVGHFLKRTVHRDDDALRPEYRCIHAERVEIVFRFGERDQNVGNAFASHHQTADGSVNVGQTEQVSAFALVCIQPHLVGIHRFRLSETAGHRELRLRVVQILQAGPLERVVD